MSKRDYARIADETVGLIPAIHPIADTSNLGYVLDIIDWVSDGELDFIQMGIVLDMVKARMKARLSVA